VPTPPLRGIVLRLSVAPGLNGVADVAVIADLVARGGTPRRKVTPSLLPGLGTLSLRPVGAVVGGVTTASPCLWGTSIGEVPIGSSRHLGWLGEHGAAPGYRASPHSAAHWSLGPACRRCLPGGRWWLPYCTLRGGSKGCWEPLCEHRIITEWVRGLLPCKVLPLALELYLSGL